MKSVKNEFERRVLRSIDDLDLCLGHKPHLLVAVSGGADSVALLRALASERGRAMCRIQAVNCNFHLRGPESDRDSEMVRRLCESLGIRLHALGFDTQEYVASHPGISLETACRELRYRAFREICDKEGCDRVAVAHNLDDNAETLLLNLMRGAGSRGLKGMRPDTPEGPEGCAVLRPMLTLSRREIEEYLHEIDQEYVTDSSNLETDYSRNFLRLEVLPLLETRWPSAKASLAASAAILGEENALVNEILEELCPHGSRQLDLDKVRECAAPVSLLLHFISPFGGTPAQAAEMARLPRRTGARWILESGLTAEARPDGWIITGDSPEREWLWKEVEMTPEEWERLKHTRATEGVYVPGGPEKYAWRTVRRGDRMRPSGLKGSKLVSDLLKEAGVPVSRRAEWRVLVDAATDEIIWLEGVRRSSLLPVPSGAKRAWRLSSTAAD